MTRPLARHPLAADALLALALLAVSALDLAHTTRLGASAAFTLALVAPLAWRRRAPLPVFLTT